jgi:hypothetical protein
MKKEISINGYLPDTVNSGEHKAAQQFVSDVSEMVIAKSGTVGAFRFKMGLATVEVTGDEAISHLTQEFQSAGATVKATPSILAGLERNKNAQEKINKTRKTRDDRKKGVGK